MENQESINIYIAPRIDVLVTRENGICKFAPVTERGEKECAEIKCAKFGKTLIIQEKMFQGIFDYLVMHKQLVVAETVTKHQNQN